MNEELKFLRKFTKKNFGEGGVGRCSGWGGQGGCEVFVKIQKKIGWGWGGSDGGGWVGWGVRVDVIEELKFLWKLKKKNEGGVGFGGGGGLGWGGGGGVRVDVKEELKFLRKFTKEKIISIFFFFLGGGGGHGVDVNREVKFL